MLKQSNNEQLLHIATLGKSVGLKGDMKFHSKTDFPEQFVPGASFKIAKNKSVSIAQIDMQKGLIRLEGVTTPEDAKKYTNAKLFTTYEETRKNCFLDEGEYFFFDLEDCEVFEDEKRLGKVYDVERIASTNYLNILTDKKLVEQGYAKRFLVPFIEPFKVAVDIQKKTIVLQGAFDILEAS